MGMEWRERSRVCKLLPTLILILGIEIWLRLLLLLGNVGTPLVFEHSRRTIPGGSNLTGRGATRGYPGLKEEQSLSFCPKAYRTRRSLIDGVISRVLPTDSSDLGSRRSSLGRRLKKETHFLPIHSLTPLCLLCLLDFLLADSVVP